MEAFTSSSIYDKKKLCRGLALSGFYQQQYNQFDMRPHHHLTSEIMYVVSGKATILYTLDGVNYQEIHLGAKQYVFIDSEVRHKLVIDTPNTSMLNCEVVFTDDTEGPITLEKLYESDSIFRYFIDHATPVFECVDNHFVSEAMKIIQKYMLETDKEDRSPLELSCFLSALFLSVGSSYYEQYSNPRKSRINSAINFIHNHFSEQISTQDVADSCGISANYLNTIFKQRFFCCVNEYINKFRVKVVCERLEKTDTSLSDLMHEAGFNNKMTFNRNFIKYAGVTPGKYKKDAKKKSYEISVLNQPSSID